MSAPHPSSASLHEGTPDAQLVQASLARDERAWRLLVNRYKRLVYSIPHRYRFGADACDDVFQNVFCILWKNLPRLREASTLAKWLMTTTHRECWKLSRKAGGGVSLDHAPEHLQEAPKSDDLERWERQHILHQALRELGGPCEALLRAIFLERSEPSYAEIADRLSMPVGSIGPARARCLAKLQRIVPQLAGS